MLVSSQTSSSTLGGDRSNRNVIAQFRNREVARFRPPVAGKPACCSALSAKTFPLCYVRL